MTRITDSIATLACSAALAGSASAAPIVFDSDASTLDGSPGVSFTGEANWTWGGGSNGSLEIAITNTTGGAIGGFLTGFAFNLGGFDAVINLSSATIPGFVGVTNVNAQPFGMSFDAGAAIGGNWQGGGRPQGGVAPGQTGVFVFNVASAQASNFSSMTVFDGPEAHDFVARFRGLSDGGSSKIGAAPRTVPAPGGAALMGVSLLMAAGRRRARLA